MEDDNTSQNPHMDKTTQHWAVRSSWEALLMITGMETKQKSNPHMASGRGFWMLLLGSSSSHWISFVAFKCGGPPVLSFDGAHCLDCLLTALLIHSLSLPTCAYAKPLDDFRLTFTTSRSCGRLWWRILDERAYLWIVNIIPFELHLLEFFQMLFHVKYRLNNLRTSSAKDI